MADYLVAVFTDLVRHSESWNKIPRDPMAGIMGEYKNIAEKTASEFGQIGHNFTGDGHFFLFRNADAAVRFGLTLLLKWRQASQSLAALKEWDPIPLRIGAHFGVEAKLDDESWVGRCGNTAKSIEGKADPDALLVSEGMLDLVDLPLYEFSRFGSRKLKSDHVDSRVLYRIDTFNREGFLNKPEEDLTASDWFLKGVALIGTDEQLSERASTAYENAILLWPGYLEAHINYANLLSMTGRPNDAEQHYKEALLLRPDDPGVHNNYAILLAGEDRPSEAEEHFKESLRLRPDDPETHYNYAITQRQLDHPAEAEKSYMQALELRPDFPEAHFNYAGLLCLLGRPKEAEEQYREALRLRPDDPKIKRAVGKELWNQTPPNSGEEKS